jgi:hypothetical protein
MQLKSNGGTMEVKKQAIMPGYHMQVWYNKKAITNILSLSNMIKQYQVTYDSNDQMFVIHCDSERKPDMEFWMHKSGLHYFNPRDSEFAFVNTVSENKAGFMKRQIKDMEVTRSLYSKLNYPSWKDFKWIIWSNQIKDYSVTVKHIDTALKIWGKNVVALKGKTTRTKPDPVARDFVKVPVELLKLHKEAYITADLFFVNKILFFIMLSCKICFMAINHLANRTFRQIFMVLKKIYQYYLKRGFHIKTVHVDVEFAPLKVQIESLLGGPMVNLASPNEHIPEIEQRIWVVKERSQAAHHSLPFQCIPKLLMIHIVLNAVKILNCFPMKGGIPHTLSTKTIMSGETLDCKKHLSLQVGQYCQVHEEDTSCNSQSPRTKGAISLGPSGNLQGGYKFMALNTGKKITCQSWDVIPMPDTVIACVNALEMTNWNN